MNNKFTVEEVNLICIFECKSRTKVISDIKRGIIRMCEQVAAF